MRKAFKEIKDNLEQANINYGYEETYIDGITDIGLEARFNNIAIFLTNVDRNDLEFATWEKKNNAIDLVKDKYERASSCFTIPLSENGISYVDIDLE